MSYGETALGFEEGFEHPRRRHECDSFFAGHTETSGRTLRPTALAAHSEHPNLQR